MATLQASDLHTAFLVNGLPVRLEFVGDEDDDIIVMARADLEKLLSVVSGRAWTIDRDGARQGGRA